MISADRAPDPTLDRVRTALLAALCASIGYALATVPNIELISTAVFVCGAHLGVRRGAVIGLLAEGIYAGVNPNGISPPPLYAAQVLGFGLVGAGGGVMRPVLGRAPIGLQAALAAGCGFALTLAYDVLTGVAVWFMAREGASLAAIVLGGLSFPFPLAHAGFNTLAFAVAVPAVLRAIRRRGAA